MGESKTAKKQEIPSLFLQDPKYIRNLVYCKNDKTFYLYRGGWYEPLEKEDLLALIRKFMMSEPSTCKMNLPFSAFKDVFEQLMLALRESKSTFTEYDYDYIAFKDVMFNFRTLKAEPIDDNNRKFTPFFLNYNWAEIKNETEINKKDPLESLREKDKAPHFCKFLETSVVYEKDLNETDYETIYTIQEWMGYYLGGFKKKTVALFLIGGGSNGKSVLSSIILNMFEQKFISANTLDEITNDSSRIASLQGKRLNFAAEDESKKMKNDKFKALISNDLIEARRLWEKSFVFTPICKFLFSSQRYPQFESVDNGIRRRVRILPMFNTFAENQMDRSLVDKIKLEMAPIVGWAINGAMRLVENNYCFTNSPAMLKARQRFENKMSTVMLFISENYVKSEHSEINGTVLYAEYEAWCKENKAHPYGKIKFFDQIDANIVKKKMDRGTTLFPLGPNKIKMEQHYANQPNITDEVKF